MDNRSPFWRTLARNVVKRLSNNKGFADGDGGDGGDGGDDGGDGDAAAKAAADAAAAAAGTNWAAALPPDQKAIVDNKGWKSPSDVLKSYTEVEKLVGYEKIAMPKKDKDGNFVADDMGRAMDSLGRPKNPTDYKTSENFKLPEAFAMNETSKAAFDERAHKAGLLPHQYAFMMDEFSNASNQAMTAQAEAKEKAFTESTLALRTKWGAAYETKAALANNVLKNFMSKEAGNEFVEKFGNDPQAIELLATIGGNLSEDAMTNIGLIGSGVTPEQAKIQIDELMASPAYMDNGDPKHAWIVKKVFELNKIVASASN